MREDLKRLKEAWDGIIPLGHMPILSYHNPSGPDDDDMPDLASKESEAGPPFPENAPVIQLDLRELTEEKRNQLMQFVRRLLAELTRGSLG